MVSLLSLTHTLDIQASRVHRLPVSKMVRVFPVWVDIRARPVPEEQETRITPNSKILNITQVCNTG